MLETGFWTMVAIFAGLGVGSLLWKDGYRRQVLAQLTREGGV